MRIATFSDVHANLPALEAVLAHVKTQAFDAAYCLGDLVGYAPFPNEVIERIRQEASPPSWATTTMESDSSVTIADVPTVRRTRGNAAISRWHGQRRT